MLLRSLKRDIAQKWVDADGTTALYWSGGADSSLLLAAMLDLKMPFSIITFDQTFSPEQMKAIDAAVIEHGLRVFSYPPYAAYMIGDGKELAFVEEYRFLDGTLIPFIRDCVGGSRCSFDVSVETRTSETPVGFTLNIFGTRNGDRHWAWGRAATEKTVKLGHGIIYSPLWDWTREQVIGTLRDEYGITMPDLDTGDFQACVDCLKDTGKVFCPKAGEMIDSVDWQPRAVLEAFQDKYGVKNEP